VKQSRSEHGLKAPPALDLEFGSHVATALLLCILAAAAALRWYGLAWDAGYLFHPDERQILLIASNLSLPNDAFDLLSPSSPLNPHFFAYGSLPIYLLRALEPLAPPSNIAGPWANDSLARWIIFARAVSGMFDLGTIVLTFLLGRRLYDARVGLVASACIAVTVLHIQLSHFYAVDTLLSFFVVATLYATLRYAEHPSRKWNIICGLTLGLALATKVSALPLVFPIAFACYHARGRAARGVGGQPLKWALEVWRDIRRPFLQICAIALVVFILTQPYALIDWFEFGRDVIREALVARGWLDYPYTRQYANSLPYIYQIVQGAIWGMGLPLGILAWGGAALFVYRFWRRRGWREAFVLSWSLLYFIFIGAQYVKYPRYLLPLFPLLFIMAAQAFLTLRLPRGIPVTLLGFVLGASTLYSIAFVSIYGREHPWLTASRWIFQNTIPGSNILVEEWDDALPVQIKVGGVSHRGSELQSTTLRLYEPDNSAKFEEIADALSRAELVIVASQRAYGSIGRLPQRYPLTTRYYDKLFDGDLGFELAETARNDPQLGGWSIADDPRAGLGYDTAVPPDDQTLSAWNWGFADESLTVYDHPQPLVFRKTRVLSAPELYDQLMR
jgi:4-amino-4-deoxy-L-arabinose transferase-like glycosyltransferase